MNLKLHGTDDQGLKTVAEALQSYLAAHPRARVELYRDKVYSAIRVQVVDPRFHVMDWSERHDDVTAYLKGIDPVTYGDIYSLVLLTPREVGKTGHSLKFLDLMPPPEVRPAPAAARTKKPKS